MTETGYKFSSAQAGDHDELNELVQGQGTYTSDISLPGQLHACFVRSPWAHARITSLDVTEAQAMSGVRAVVTARDVEQAGLGPIMPLVVLKGSNGQNMHCSGMPLLAHDEVRHVGEPVALVVADTLEQAMNGAEAVQIDYDPLPCVTDLRAAIAADAPQVQAVAPGNIAMDWTLGESAELQSAFDRAHHIERIELADPMLTGAPMEPKAALAQYDAQTGRYTLIASTQGVKNIHHVLSTQVFKEIGRAHV